MRTNAYFPPQSPQPKAVANGPAPPAAKPRMSREEFVSLNRPVIVAIVGAAVMYPRGAATAAVLADAIYESIGKVLDDMYDDLMKGVK